MKYKHEKIIHTPRTNINAKRMKKPKYSNIKWIKHKKYGTNVNEENTIMKGTYNQLTKKDAYSSWVFDNEEKVYNLKIKNEEMKEYDDSRAIKIGNSLYYKGYIYAICEEITGKKILRKNWSRPVKKVCGDIIVLHTRQNPKECTPLVIEGNNGYYAIAPRKEDD